MTKYSIIVLTSHASKVMLKILQPRLQQYVNWTLPDVQPGFRKGRGTRDHIVNIRWTIAKWRGFQKINYFCFIDYNKAFDCVNHNKLWKIVKETGIQDPIICLLRNLYAGQESTVRTGHGTTDWFQIGKGILQGCIFSPRFCNFYAEYIIWNAELDESQAGIKITGKSINSLRYADQFSSVAQSCPKLCEPMNRNTPGLPVHHQLPEFTQTHVRVGDAIQPSHPPSSSSPPALNLSQHQGLFKWVSSPHELAKVLKFQLQHQSL